MYEIGLDYQIYFCLEDFQNNKENVVRNTGAFWFDPESFEYKGGPKAIYNVFMMLGNLGNEMFTGGSKINDEFVGVIPTLGKDYIALLIYNYVDSDTATNFLSRNISSLNGQDRKSLLNTIKSGMLDKIISIIAHATFYVIIVVIVSVMILWIICSLLGVLLLLGII